MKQQTVAAFRASLSELPFSELVEIDHENLTDEEKRVFLEVLQEQRQSPQKAKSVQKKQAKKLSGKSKEIDVSEFL